MGEKKNRTKLGPIVWKVVRSTLEKNSLPQMIMKCKRKTMAMKTFWE